MCPAPEAMGTTISEKNTASTYPLAAIRRLSTAVHYSPVAVGGHDRDRARVGRVGAGQKIEGG